MPEHPYLQWPVFRRSGVAAFQRSLTASFATELRQVLLDGGWPTPRVGATAFSPRGPVGVEVHIKTEQEAPAYADALQAAFTAAGFPMRRRHIPNAGVQDVHLVVGSKPGMVLPY